MDWAYHYCQSVLFSGCPLYWKTKSISSARVQSDQILTSVPKLQTRMILVLQMYTDWHQVGDAFGNTLSLVKCINSSGGRGHLPGQHPPSWATDVGTPLPVLLVPALFLLLAQWTSFNRRGLEGASAFPSRLSGYSGSWLASDPSQGGFSLLPIEVHGKDVWFSRTKQNASPEET